MELCAFVNEVGVQAPLGFFDPVGYSKDGSAGSFSRRHQSEIKTGRIGMMAAIGYCHWTHHLAYMAWSDISSSQSAASPGGNGDFGFRVFAAKGRACKRSISVGLQTRVVK